MCIVNSGSQKRQSVANFVAGETVVLDPEPACQYLLGPVLSSYYAKYVISLALVTVFLSLICQTK